MYRQYEWRNPQAVDTWNDTASGVGDIGVDTVIGDGDFAVASSCHSEWRLGLARVLRGDS